MSLRFAAPLFLLALAPVLALAPLAWPAPGRRPSVWMLLRTLAAALLVLALAQPQLGADTRRTTILVVDRSARVDRQMRATEASWAGQARAACPSPCQIVEFADGARALPDAATAPSSAAPLPASASDIEQGVRLGLGLVPRGGLLALLSGGGETQGDVLATTGLARARGVRVDVVALSDVHRRDAAITRMTAPASVHSGDPIPLALTVRSTVAAHASLYVSRDGALVGHQTIVLRAGDNPLLLSYTATGVGWESFTARIALSGDALPENDSLSSTTDVLARPRVLAVDAGAAPRGLLTRLGFALTSVPAAALPAQAGGYAGLDAVVFDDVPASALGSRQTAALDSAVRDGGLGVVALGGPHSFSGGGYAHSAIEALLPVESLVPGNLQRRNVAIELVLDRSGSMIDLAGGYPKIEMVRLGGVQTAQFVASHEDELGVVAFDAVPHVLVPVQRVTPGASERRIVAAIDGLTAEGGTNLYLGLQAGFRQLQSSTAPSKHIVLVTDGISEPEEYAPLLRQIEDSHVSVATVALGAEADTGLLERIAHATGGDFYAASSARELPQIFAKESRFAAKPVQAYGSLPVLAGADSPIVSSLSGSSLARLTGEELTNLKPGAQADLLAEVKPSELVPALAQWQDGAGRVVAWTPGFGSPWASGWSGETQTWNEMVRWSERAAPAPAPAVEVRPGAPPSLRVDLALQGASAFPISTLAVTLTSSGGARSALTLRRTGPSIYTAPLTGLAAGVYRYTLAAGTIGASGELAVPYSQEYLPEPTAATPLGQLASATGGRELSEQDPGALLAGARTSLWWVLALGALVVFLLAVFGELLRGRGPDGGPPHRRSRLGGEDGYEATSPAERAPAASRSSGSTSVGAST
ncbi:MAG TPA: VWA domain-containing protein [Solirubrobacteraceae bacterium]|nr:VWA domain-containing protein [Solirubrobacteraceae bacterium]